MPSVVNEYTAMPRLQVEDQTFDIDAVVFDKDGTLIDFHSVWGLRAYTASAALAARCGGGKALENELLAALGCDPATRQVHGAGPFAIAPLATIYTIAASVLYRHGHSWSEAEERVGEAFRPLAGAPPEPDSIRPVTELGPLFGALAAHGLRIAIATSDDRAPTEATLDYLGIRDAVDVLACGDDEALPKKPEAGLLHALAAQLGADAARLMMVSDTDSDMRMGRSAGIAACIGVLSGAGTRAQLAPCADAVVEHVGAIRIVA